MSKKTEFFWNIAVIIVGTLILAVAFGGCGKKDKDETPPEKEDTKNLVEPTDEIKPDVQTDQLGDEMTEKGKERAELLEEAEKKVAEMSEIEKIATKAQGWNPVMREWYGKDAPDMLVKDINGALVKVSNYKGKKVVILKWSSMVQPSKDMLNDLAKIKGDNEGLVIMAVTTERVEQLTGKIEIPNVVLIPGPHKLVEPYRSVRDIPSAVFIGTDSKIKLVTTQRIPADVIEEIIKAE